MTTCSGTPSASSNRAEPKPEIKQQYGSYDNYLEQALGLTDEERKKLQDLYLEGSGEMR